MEQEMLDLAPTPRNPAMVLYGAWDGLMSYYGNQASIGDRVSVRRDSEDETRAITLRCSRYYQNFLTLWPDGSFEFHRHLFDRFRWWEQHTFLDFQWAIRERVLTVKPMENDTRRWIDPRDWHQRKPYVRLGVVVPGVRYWLMLDGDNRWTFRTLSKPWQETLDAEHAFVQARYDRFQRRAENHGKVRAKNPLALHVPGSHLTGDAAVKQMASHMIVHAQRPREGS